MIFMVNVRKYTSPMDGTGITPCKFSSFYFTKGDGTQSFSSVKNLFSTFFLALETAFCPPCLLLVWPSTWTWHLKGWCWSDAVGLDVCSEPSSLSSLSPTARRLHGENMMQKQQNESQFQMLLEMLGDSIFSNRINQTCFDHFGIHSEGIPDGFWLLRFQGIMYIFMFFLFGLYISSYEYAMNSYVCFVYFLQWWVFIEIDVSSLT